MAARILAAVVGALASATLALAAADHWILTHAQTLVLGRMDPIIAPGAVSSHVHNVVGASNFQWEINDVDTQLEAACSTVVVADDKSNYWAPLLNYQYENGTFAPILSGARIYYFTKGTDVQPFPSGLRMITGSATAKNLSSTETLGIRISCDEGQDSFWLPNATSHPGGCATIAMGVFFPSCGLSTGDLDSDDHFSHMAWPQNYNGSHLVDDPNGQYCPESHPIKYPAIFAQFNYYLNDDQPWRDDECTVVLANGDCSGNTYHADFVNGWEPDTLQAAITECGDGNGPGDDLTACAPLAASTNESATWDCRLEGTIPAEQVGIYLPIASLPGCNPLWKSSVLDKPTCDTTAQDPGMVGPNVYFENLVYRTHIPMALAEVTDTLDIDQWVPALGNDAESRLQVWGSDGVDVANMTVGTLEEILAAMVGGSNSTTSSSAVSSTDSVESASTIAASATSVSSTVSSAVSAASGKYIPSYILHRSSGFDLDIAALATSDTESLTASASTTATALSVSTSVSGTCTKRKKRNLAQNAAARHQGRSRHHEKHH